MPDKEKRLYEIIAAIIEKHEASQQINPAWIATEAMARIDPEKIGPELEWLGCHLQFRQIARGMCAKKFDPVDGEQDDLFPDTLQKRYPKAHTDENDPVYVLLEHMTDEDVSYNVKRLRKEARAKLAHADALEAWGVSRQRAA